MRANNKTTSVSIYNPGLDDYSPPSPYFRLLNLPRQTYKIIPDYDISNLDNISIVNTLGYMYKPPGERIDYKRLSYYLSRQYWFDILFQDGKANFYATSPEDYSDLVESKMKTVWNKANISKVNGYELEEFDITKTEVCTLVLKDYNIKSLSTDKTNLYPLTNMFGIIKMLKKDEKVRVNIVIEPISRINWLNLSKDEHKVYKQGKVRNNELSTKEKLMQLGFKSIELLLNLYIEYKMIILQSFLGLFCREHKERNKVDINLDNETLRTLFQTDKLSTASNYKLAAETFKVKISILSQSSDQNRAKLNMLAVANAYKDLNEDNELTIKLLSKKEQMNLHESIMRGYVLTNKRCILSDKEVAKLIQLPQKTLQQEYKIESIDTREVTIPKELQGGKIRIGVAQKQGKAIITTWSQDKNIMALAKIFVGPQYAGKTTAVKRTIKDCYIANYSNVIIDFIENCDTAKEIANSLPSRDKVIIKLGYEEYIPSMAYNEVSALITEDMGKWERVRLANLISEQVEYLINAVTDEGTGELTAPMLRFLHSACMVTFIKPGAKIEDVFIILRKWDKRNEAIRYAKYSECFSKDDDIFFDLEELHKREKDSGKIIGTRDDLIVGVLNRITLLKKNPYLGAMLKADINNNENFTNYIEKGKQIFIMIPQTRFPSAMVRDILTTYYISRIWLAAQMRENNKDARLCNIVFDEVHQVPTTAKFLSNHITEMRRHRLGLILSCHFLKQLKTLLTGLKSSGASYVLLAGTERENLETLREEIKPFTIEEGMNLKPFTSLNVVNYGNQYAKFICRLPKV